MGFGLDHNHPSSPPAAAFAALLGLPPLPPVAAAGQFQPDGLTNTALHPSEEQGFHHKVGRQTFRDGAGWGNYGVGDSGARMEFADRMGKAEGGAGDWPWHWQADAFGQGEGGAGSSGKDGIGEKARHH